MKAIKVYIAGPYSVGDTCQHVRTAIDIAERLLDAGMAPYIPHLAHFWSLVHQHTTVEWEQYYNPWLDMCDALIRFPGESRGADKEVARANKKGIKVFYDIDCLIGYYQDTNHG